MCDHPISRWSEQQQGLVEVDEAGKDRAPVACCAPDKVSDRLLSGLGRTATAPQKVVDRMMVEGVGGAEPSVRTLQQLFHHLRASQVEMEARLSAQLASIDARPYVAGIDRSVKEQMQFVSRSLEGIDRKMSLWSAPLDNQTQRVLPHGAIDESSAAFRTEQKLDESKHHDESKQQMKSVQKLPNVAIAAQLATRAPELPPAAGDENLGDDVSLVINEAPRPSTQSPRGHVKQIVLSPVFDMLIGVVVVFNSLLLGLQVNHEATVGEDSFSFNTMEYLCTAVFTVEFLLRLSVFGRSYFRGKERMWSALDALLVSLSWVDIVMTTALGDIELSGPSAQAGKLLKVARLARIMRILRVFRFFIKIRIMASMILGSMASLFWLFVLLFGVIYVFAIVITKGAADWLLPAQADNANLFDASYARVQLSWGSVPKAMYTLLMSITGGVSWGEPAGDAQPLGLPYFACFLFFIFFCFFSVLNIVTGLFVDGAIQQASNDRASVQQRAEIKKKQTMNSILEVLREIDVDNSHFISKEEWYNALKDDSIVPMLDSLEITTTDAEHLWNLLDRNSDGVIEIHEFVEGMSKFKGAATGIDMHMVLKQLATLDAHLTQVVVSPSPAHCTQEHN